jgi:hypothetical protein
MYESALHWTAGQVPILITSWVNLHSYNVLIIAITLYYVDEQFRLHEDLLDFQAVSVSHTGLNLTEHVLSILFTYGIQAKLYCITTDNASNNGTMMKALARLLEAHGIIWDPVHNHIACLAHVLNLARPANEPSTLGARLGSLSVN